MASIRPAIAPLPPLRITNFAGINLADSPTEIADNESPDMLNMTCENGYPEKRPGYEKTFPTSLGAGKVNGLFYFRKKDGTVKKLLAHGTKLYEWDKGVQPTEIYNGIADTDVFAFTMNDKMYFLDGTNYLVYDGTTVAPVTPYIPTLTVSTPPTGGGTVYEDFNLLGAGFKQLFSGNGSATVYQLALTGLDATAVSVKINGTPMTEGSGFTVDRVNGKVTFTSAPANGTNNVEITAYKTVAGNADKIKKCRFAVLFGGANDTRPFVSGNPDYPDYVWRLGLFDPTYAPENGFYKIGSDAEKVQGFSKQYDYLVIEKEFRKYSMTYELVNGVASFPIKPINDQVGTYAPKSIQNIENSPVSLFKTGVYKLVGGLVRDERNVVHISRKVDPKLLKEPNLDKAISFDFNRQYWVVVNGNAYVLDYNRKSDFDQHGIWYLYDNINASCFLEMDGDLYFGSSTDGMVYRFKKRNESVPYNDDGVLINGYWKSKHFSFGASERRKLVEKVFFTLKPDGRTSANLYYVTNKKISDLVKTTSMDLLDFNNIDFGRFSFLASAFPQEASAKIKAKKVTHFQVEFRNGNLNESMGIMDTTIKFRYQSEVK